MSSIGPELPPHLRKKREEAKRREVAAPPPPAAEEEVAVGPALPPHLRRRKPEPAAGEDDDEVGPALPPTVGPMRPPVAGPSRPPTVGPSRPSPTVGPARPPSSSIPSRPPPADDSDSDDDLVGPLPPSTAVLAQLRDPEYLRALQQQEAEERIAQAEKARADAEAEERERAARGPQRGEWMIVPPTAKPIGLPGPGPARSRQFATREANHEIDRAWVETPQQRAERLAKIAAAEARKARDEPKPMSERDRQLAAAVADFNAAHRPASLLEAYDAGLDNAKRRRTDASDDPTKRGFDRDRDVLSRAPIDGRARAKMVAEAKTMDSRFSHGSSAFL
ncbi:hypothetical protein H9P43_005575 [Blastocladiella emersonii ATCC 22665]|nr:hypothetical protein H9P43_005575 [Blastocladiella emersonii ATCC 22665]